MQGFTFVLPEGFDPLDYLSGKLAKRADCARWMVHMILWKVLRHSVDRHGYARLSAKILRRVMGQRCHVAVVRALEAGGVIEVAPHKKDVKPKGYRLTRRFLLQRFVRVKALDRELIRRIHRELDRMRAEGGEARLPDKVWLPIHHALNRAQEALSVSPEVDRLLDGLDPDNRSRQESLIDGIRRGTPNFSVCGTGRVFNGITGIMRVLRPALRLADEPMAGADLSCAQPALLALLIHLSDPGGAPTYKRWLVDALDAPWLLGPPTKTKKDRDDAGDAGSFLVPSTGRRDGRRFADVYGILSGAAPPSGPDFPIFLDLVLSGLFYDDLVDRCLAADVVLSGRNTDTPREFVKKVFLTDTVARKRKYPSGVDDVFAHAFPSVYAFIKWVNRKDLAAPSHKHHATLIRTLQRLESWLVIEQVCPRLVDHIPIVTLHDAIYGRVSDIGLIRAAFEETFDEIGFRLELKDEGSVQVPFPPPCPATPLLTSAVEETGGIGLAGSATIG